MGGVVTRIFMFIIHKKRHQSWRAEISRVRHSPLVL